MAKMREGLCLVVVCVLEGRNFPRRDGYYLTAECGFDGEALSTDPIAHVESPDFMTELAWEIDGKVLQQHKMRRTPIKLQCFSVNSSSAVREQVGYVLLGLRLAQWTSQSARWYTLLSKKYARLKPAIKIRISLERDLPACSKDFEARSAAALQRAAPQKLPSRHSFARFNEGAEYYQIGPTCNSCEMFMLSVTTTFAGNLEQLIPSDTDLSSSDGEFYFHYSLFGIDVIGSCFTDIFNPPFSQEETSVCIRSSVDALRAFLMKEPSLQIRLCRAGLSLGQADIPLDALFGNVNVKLMETGGTFDLRPSIHQLDGLTKARVGVSVTLVPKRMCSAQDHAVDRSPKNELYETCGSPNGKTYGIKRKPSLSAVKKQKSASVLEEPEPSAFSDDLINTCLYRDTQPLGTSRGEATTESVSTNFTTTATHPLVPPLQRHFRFSQHFKSISNLELPFSCNVYLKYAYPFFGSAAPVLTSPAVEIPRGLQSKFSHSLCIFDFSCYPPLLQSTFSCVPLEVELWNKNKDSDDILLATCVIPLQLLLVQKPVHHLIIDEGPVKRRIGTKFSMCIKLGMTSVHKPYRKLASLNVRLSLEDMGPVVEQKVLSQMDYQRLQSQLN